MKKKGPASQFVQNENDEHNLGTRDRTRIKKKGKLGMRPPWCAKSARLRMKLLYSHPFLLLKEAASSSNLCRRKSHMPRRRKKIFGNNGEDNSRHKLVDKLSALPDEILLSIVSLLPLKDAVATSILSKRWQYVGTSTMNLNFDAKFEVGERKIRFIRMKPELRFLETRRYVNGVNNVLLQHRGPAIERFRVCFDIDGRFTSSIDKWVQFAMNKGVKILELVFHLEYAGFPKDAYPFPSNLLGLKNDTTSNLKPGHTDILSLRSCGYNTGFKFLEVLHFRYVDVSGEVLEYFLSNCPVLERLTVFGGQKSLVNLRVVGPSVALKHLEIMCCISLKSIEICDASLVSFKYDGHMTDLVLSNVPLLVEVSISETLADTFMYGGEFYFRSIELHFTQLSCCLSQLKVLMLDIDGAMYNPDLGFPILSNLEHLELIVAGENSQAVSHLTSFMKAAPYLQRLVLKFGKSLGSCEVRRNQERVEKFPHQNLKVVEIIGYRARKYALEHVMYLINCAVALERIVIDPVRRWDYPGEFPREMDRGAKEVKEEHQGRDHAKQDLKEKVPSTIEFVCL